MSSLITYAVPIFGKYNRMKEYIKELEENIDDLEHSLQELEKSNNDLRIHLVNRSDRYEWIVTMILSSILTLLAAFAATFPYTTCAFIGPLVLAGIFFSSHIKRVNEEREHIS